MTIERFDKNSAGYAWYFTHNEIFALQNRQKAKSNAREHVFKKFV